MHTFQFCCLPIKIFMFISIFFLSLILVNCDNGSAKSNLKNIDRVRVGMTESDVIRVMAGVPDYMYVADSFYLRKVYHRNIKTFEYKTPFGSIGNIVIYFQADTVLHKNDDI